MDRHRPGRFDVDPNASDAAESWTNWHCTFVFFLKAIEHVLLDKPKSLFKYLKLSVFRYVKNCRDYDVAISTLQSTYMQSKNEVLARSLTMTCKQEDRESTDQSLYKLTPPLGNSNYQVVTADAFGQGPKLSAILQTTGA